MTGVGATHSDIGGYISILWLRRSVELLLRWTERDVFSPMIKMHLGFHPETNHQFDTYVLTLKSFKRLVATHSALSSYTKKNLDEY